VAWSKARRSAITKGAARDRELRPAIDKFFDKVMVMVDDANLRAESPGLLQTVVKDLHDRRFLRDRDRRQRSYKISI